ncbi:MAG TPA: hypothetical protein VD790_05910 [Thermoleophilaceae bacterium]|nr:hypothetical protein [Thermoleophilaceae bacterium]
MRYLWYLLAVALLASSVFAGLLAYGALSNLWADYQDSPTSTYLAIGLPALMGAVVLLAAAVQAVRRGS